MYLYLPELQILLLQYKLEAHQEHRVDSRVSACVVTGLLCVGTTGFCENSSF